MCFRLFGIAAFVLGVSATVANAAETQCVGFTWGKIAFDQFQNERASILVPVSVSALNGVVSLQLDTGSSQSMLYDGAFSLPHPVGEIETSIGIAGEGWASSTRKMTVKKDMAATTSKGTLGVDLMGASIVLDMKNQLLCPLTEQRAQRFKNWTSFERSGKSPVITVNDGTKDLRLILDTGSGAFSIISTTDRSKPIKEGVITRKIEAPSFGSTITVSERVPAGSYTAFGKTLETPFVYAFEHPFAGLMLDRGKIDGLIGLAPFSNGTLAFDFTNNRVAFAED